MWRIPVFLLLIAACNPVCAEDPPAHAAESAGLRARVRPAELGPHVGSVGEPKWLFVEFENISSQKLASSICNVKGL